MVPKRSGANRTPAKTINTSRKGAFNSMHTKVTRNQAFLNTMYFLKKKLTRFLSNQLTWKGDDLHCNF
jgi:hypothetical protein